MLKLGRCWGLCILTENIQNSVGARSGYCTYSVVTKTQSLSTIAKTHLLPMIECSQISKHNRCKQLQVEVTKLGRFKKYIWSEFYLKIRSKIMIFFVQKIILGFTWEIEARLLNSATKLRRNSWLDIMRTLQTNFTAYVGRHSKLSSYMLWTKFHCEIFRTLWVSSTAELHFQIISGTLLPMFHWRCMLTWKSSHNELIVH